MTDKISIKVENRKVLDNEKDIKVEDFTITANKKPLIIESELKIISKKRYALIGANGSGKTTLLSLLATRCFPTPKNFDMYLVE